MRGAGGVVCQAARKVREATAAQRQRWKVSTPPPRGATWAYKYIKRSGRNCSRVFAEALGGRGVVLRGQETELSLLNLCTSPKMRRDRG